MSLAGRFSSPFLPSHNWSQGVVIASQMPSMAHQIDHVGEKGVLSKKIGVQLDRVMPDGLHSQIRLFSTGTWCVRQLPHWYFQLLPWECITFGHASWKICSLPGWGITDDYKDRMIYKENVKFYFILYYFIFPFWKTPVRFIFRILLIIFQFLYLNFSSYW